MALSVSFRSPVEGSRLTLGSKVPMLFCESCPALWLLSDFHCTNGFTK